MKKMLCAIGVLCLFFVSGLTFSETNSQAETNSQTAPPVETAYETATPGKFLQEWMDDTTSMQGTLVLLDLDDTSISTPANTWLGSSEMFYQFRDQLREKYPHLTKQQVMARMDPLFLAVFSQTPVILTDHRLPETIDRLKKSGVNVIGITARAPTTSSVTLKQLQQLGLSFSASLKDSHIDMKGNYPVEVKGGVMFVGHGYPKGSALVALLKAGKLGHPKKIILVDDRDEHLKSTSEALTTWNKTISFIPVLCTYPQGRREGYQDKAAKTELLHLLYDHRENAEFKRLIKYDLYTASFIVEECEQPSSENKAACEVILPLSNR